MSRRLLPVVGVVALLVAAMALSAFGNPAIEALPVQLRPVASGSPQPLDPPDAVDQNQPAPPEAQAPTTVTGGVLLAGLIVVVLLLGVGIGWWYVRGRASVRIVRIGPVARAPEPSDVGRLRAAIDEGLTELDEGDADPRRAVIACWVRLERAAASAGTARQPGDTSTDLVARLLAGHRVDAELLAELAARYREARFARHTIDAATRDQVRSALRRVRDQLGVRA
jgi:Domain of unknown function (DUF4129)